jgi:hypothetical protein
VQHQGEQSERFGFGRQQLDEQAADPDRFLRQVAAGGVGARRIAPAWCSASE